MERNWDVVREILLGIEESPPGADAGSIRMGVVQRLKEKFDAKDVTYSIIDYHFTLLESAGLIKGSPNRSTAGTNWRISGMTWYGHDFLDDIRDDGVWKKTKERFGKVGGSLSFEMLKELSKAVVKEVLSLK